MKPILALTCLGLLSFPAAVAGGDARKWEKQEKFWKEQKKVERDWLKAERKRAKDLRKHEEKMFKEWRKFERERARREPLFDQFGPGFGVPGGDPYGYGAPPPPPLLPPLPPLPPPVFY